MIIMTETPITRNYFVPFIDTSQGATADGYTWERIDKSTVLEIQANAETEDLAYIAFASDQTQLKSYRPTLDQEIAIERGNPIYDFVFDLFYEMDATNAKVPFLMVFPKAAEADTDCPAWLYDDAQLVLQSLNPVDGKITFQINLNGDGRKGDVTVASGSPVFTDKS